MADVQHIGSFVARDAAGKEHLIDVYQKFIAAATADDPHGKIGGVKRIVTPDGRIVNRVDTGQYQILVPGRSPIDVTTTDPSAP